MDKNIPAIKKLKILNTRQAKPSKLNTKKYLIYILFRSIVFNYFN